MKKRVRYTLFIVAFLVTAVVLSGCRQKYQTEERINNGMSISISVAVTGPADDLRVLLFSPVGTYVKQNIEKLVMEHMNGPVTVCLPFCELGLKGHPCSFDNNTKRGVYTLIIQKTKSERIVFKKTIELIGRNETVSIARAEGRAGL